MLKDVELLITGGTIDSEWAPSKDTVVPSACSSVKPYIEKFLKPDFPIYENIIAMADSRDIDDNVRAKILKAIIESRSDNIIITHGTYTMAQTGKYLKEKIALDKRLKENKKIILLGSFYPLGFSQSDAPFNLGYAFGAIEYLSPNVYVAMNSRLFDPYEVGKDVQNGKFIIDASKGLRSSEKTFGERA